MLLDESASEAGGAGFDLSGGAGGYYLATGQTSARAHIHHIVCAADYVQIMFNNHHGGAFSNQTGSS